VRAILGLYTHIRVAKQVDLGSEQAQFLLIEVAAIALALIHTRPAHLAAWRVQTSLAFAAGGHW